MVDCHVLRLLLHCTFIAASDGSIAASLHVQCLPLMVPAVRHHCPARPLSGSSSSLLLRCVDHCPACPSSGSLSSLLLRCVLCHDRRSFYYKNTAHLLLLAPSAAVVVVIVAAVRRPLPRTSFGSSSSSLMLRCVDHCPARPLLPSHRRDE